jgi:hypothetical protein
MLSIVVNDALMGIDIMKKYPAFYARMLADEELRTAFLDTLELLEEGRAGKLPAYSDSDTFNPDFLQKVVSQPVIRRSAKDKLELFWERTVRQLQTMFFINSLEPGEVLRSGSYLAGEGTINILHSQVEVDDQELDIRLNASHTLTNPGSLDLMMTISTPEELPYHFELTIVWGDYQETAAVSKYGLAKFPPLKRDQIITPTGELMHGLELRLEQV